MTYDEFIQNILNSRERFQKELHPEKYYERHHIIPRKIGGTNFKDNLVDLTLEEHFIAHKLLALEHPDDINYTYPYYFMSHVKGRGQEIATPEEYAEAKELLLKTSKTLFKKGHIPWHKGKTKETDDRLKLIGLKNKEHMTGYKQSEECCEKHTKQMLRIWEERKEEGFDGWGDKVYEKVSDKTKEAMKRPEIKAKVDAANLAKKGLKWFNNGKIRIHAKECPEGFVPGMGDFDGYKNKGGRPIKYKGEKIMINMKVYKDREDVKFPTKAHSSDAGFDLYAPEDIELIPGQKDFAIIDTHIHFDIPVGYVGMIKSKSGLNTKLHIASEGVIDALYTGSVVVKLTLNSQVQQEKHIKKGEKITQIVFMPVPVIHLEEVDALEKFDSYNSERGNNGFGSSGK